MVTSVYAELNYDRLRINKALGIFWKVTKQHVEQPS